MPLVVGCWFSLHLSLFGMPFFGLALSPVAVCSPGMTSPGHGADARQWVLDRHGTRRCRLRKFRTVVAAAILILACGQSQSSFGAGRIIQIYPGTDVFGPAAQTLSAGDTLIVHQGIY